MVVSGLTAPACHAQSPQGQRATRAPADVETSMDAPSQPETRSGPASRFATLDEYLAFLEKGAAIDKAYYRKVGPDLYELVTTIEPPPPTKRHTRAELARQIGFDESPLLPGPARGYYVGADPPYCSRSPAWPRLVQSGER